jgi:hypothetical protein
MADENERVKWESVLAGRRLPQAPRQVNQATRRVVRVSEAMEWALIALVIGNVVVLWSFLGTWTVNNGWVARSRFFQILGGAFMFAFLCLAGLCGLVLWLVGDNKTVAVWADKKLPIGDAAPDRVATGTFVACVLVGLLLGALIGRHTRSRRDGWMWLAALTGSLLVFLAWTVARGHTPVEPGAEVGFQ